MAQMALRELARQLECLNDEIMALHLTIGDRPADDASVAAALEDTVLGLMVLTPAALMHVREASDSIGPRMDIQRSRRSLSDCQASLQQFDNGFNAVYSRHQFNELARIGGTRGHEWLRWANTTAEAIEKCREIVSRVWNALTVCWQEAAELDETR